MRIEEIIEEIQGFEDYLDRAFGIGVPPSIDAAIEKLRTHPDAQPNEPLTLEELRGMVGQPVWVESPGVNREVSGRWTIVAAVNMEERALYTRGDYTCRFYGVVWIAYRRPPKEEV